MREEETHKGKHLPVARVEKVVVFLPDIWSVLPTMMEYASLKDSYNNAMLCKLGLSSKPEPTPEEVSKQTSEAAKELSQPPPTASSGASGDKTDQTEQALILINPPSPRHYMSDRPHHTLSLSLRLSHHYRPGVSSPALAPCWFIVAVCVCSCDCM